jgi:hypothetical protein
MRNLIDIITEATIADYPMGTTYLISGSQPGRAMADVLSHQGVNIEEPMVSIDQSEVDPKQIKATVGKNKPGIASQAFRDADDTLWVYYGGASGMNSCFVHADKLANRGEIAEGILGAAMFAKFTKRAPSAEIAQVTPQDIERILNTLKQTGEDTYEIEVNDADNKHADKIGFRLILNSTSAYKDLMDPAKRGALVSEFASAAAYTNTPNAERYSRYFYVNGKSDYIQIIADGKSLQTASKVDVWVEANGKKLRLNTSLKVGGIKQFGQVGGSEMASMITLWNYFGVDVAPMTKKFEKLRSNDQFEALEYMYRNIADQLGKELRGNNDRTEASFVAKIANAVTYFATLGEKNVELVDFSKGGFKILRFNELVQKMHNVDLTATYKESKGRPEIGIHDVSDPKRELLSIRVKIENKKNGPYVRNIIEKGPLLDELTTVQKGSLAQGTGSKILARTPAPVKTAPASTSPVAKVNTPVQQPVAKKPTGPTQDYTPPGHPDYVEPDDELRYSESVRPKRSLSEIRRQRR